METTLKKSAKSEQGLTHYLESIKAHLLKANKTIFIRNTDLLCPPTCDTGKEKGKRELPKNF